MPLHLGSAKIKHYTYTLIHYYDLNPILLEINKLHFEAKNTTDLLRTHTEYFIESSNYLKLLKLIQDRVESKIKEIIPHPKRTKRGLINALGSVFKAVTGNLDANDGERYESLIKELQTNQNKLEGSILKQNSLSISVIEKFNSTLEKISHNEKIIESKINEIHFYVQKTTQKENSLFIKDVINQIINVYEVIDSILQDIENSLTFAKLKTMHPSIIKTEDLFLELVKIQNQIGQQIMPLEVNFQNTLLFEKLINIECFIFNNKITYLLHIPITYANSFNYYHIYSIPIWYQSLFKVVLPRNKYLLKNQLHFSYRGQPCQEILPKKYICDKEEPKKIQPDSPCVVKLLDSTNDTSTCQQTEVQITHPIINQLDNPNQWIIILPLEETIKLNCLNQQESRKAFGTYLLEIPLGCQVTTKEESIINNQKLIKTSYQPILFPDFNRVPTMLPTLNLSIQLQEVKLDGLHELKNQIMENQPHTVFRNISNPPSIWTVIIYLLLIGCCIVLIYKKVFSRRCPPKNHEKEDGQEMEQIQLPRQAP